jgi:hypothetical protein
MTGETPGGDQMRELSTEELGFLAERTIQNFKLVIDKPREDIKPEDIVPFEFVQLGIVGAIAAAPRREHKPLPKTTIPSRRIQKTEIVRRRTQRENHE